MKKPETHYKSYTHTMIMCYECGHKNIKETVIRSGKRVKAYYQCLKCGAEYNPLIY